MTLENSLEALAGALQAHAGALEKLAAAMAVRGAANAERFDRSDRSPAERERDEVRGTAQEWEPGGCAAVALDGIPCKPGEDPLDPPFEAPVKTPKKAAPADSESAPVAEQAAAGKISEEKPAPVAKKAEPEKKSAPLTLESARSLASSVLKTKGADTLRGLLDAVGVKKLSALTSEQIQLFCANAEQALSEA